MTNAEKSNKAQYLLAGCQKGSPRAQEELYLAYSPLLYGICLRYLPEEQEAEDVLVISFAKIFEKVNQFERNGSFEGWMKRIVINECLMHLRKKKRFMNQVGIEKADKTEVENCQTESSLEAEMLLELLQKLPDGYRAVFNLYAIEGYNHQEIGKMLNITEGTSKSQLSKARKALQEMIKAQHKIALKQ